MKNIILIIFLFFTISIHSQIPIGKDIKLGKTELKNFMAKNGFTLISDKKDITKSYNKETDKFDIPNQKIIVQLYKQEISITYFVNEFDNIESINISSKKAISIDKLKKILGYEKWKYDHTEENMMGKSDIYKTNNLSVKVPQEYGNTQFIYSE